MPPSVINPNWTRPSGSGAGAPHRPNPDWWTGPKPGEPGAELDGTGRLNVLPAPRMDTLSATQMRRYFANGWILGECLFAALADEEAFYLRPYHGLRHPLIFYYGHGAVFYINKLRQSGVLDRGINPQFEALFEMGVDEMSWDDLSQSRSDWPSVAEVQAYRREVYACIDAHVESLVASGYRSNGGPDASPLRALMMACEHERIHLETSAVLVRELPCQHLRRPAAFPAFQPRACDTALESDRSSWTAIPAQTLRFGQLHGDGWFRWDNEYGQREQAVAAFELGNNLLSNAEFADFVAADGYTRPEFWSAEGWNWREQRNAHQPSFWLRADSSREAAYLLRTLFEFAELPRSWPVEVNYHEAQAYCAWRSARAGQKLELPTEAQLRAAYRWMAQGQAPDHGSSAPYAGSPVSSGLRDLSGNLWQWCADSFAPLDQPRRDPLYPEFSVPAYDQAHQVLLGGSFLSTGRYASFDTRNYFRPHFVQHAGIRLVHN